MGYRQGCVEQTEDENKERGRGWDTDRVMRNRQRRKQNRGKKNGSIFHELTDK